MWWEPELIDRTVTRQFVCSHLLPQEIERLDRPLGFGDGLTDGTYWEWIDEKAKRIFLILVDLGVPDQIFGVIDDSWDDEDLPIALDQVERLALTPSKDEKSEKRFYYRQFYYLLRPLQQGGHNVYQENEVVPLDIVDKKQTLAATQSHHDDKVALPNQPGTVFLRRRIPVGPSSGDSSGCLSPEDFLYEINGIKNVYNQHLISYWASYTYQGNGYVLFTSATDFTLKSFLTTVPSCVKNLDKQVRRQLVMNWIHCLVDTLCFIHNRGLSHGNIKPSTVLFSNDNHVFFADFTRFNPEVMASMADKTSFDKESYDYAAPEQWFRPSSSPPSPGIRRGTLSSLGSSADSAHFSINRGSDYSSNSAMSMMHAPTPQLNPQAADVFSLGCVILELLSFLLKKHGRPFAQHRAAKHKSPGRGGAVLDSSFHKNLGQVESWMTQLAKEASKKDDQVFRGITPMLHVVERMLALHPSERPAAHDVQTKMYQILRDASGISEPHCVHQYGGWDFGIGSLKLSSSSVPRSSSYDTMSIMTKRTSSSRGHHEHTHTRTGSSSTSSMRRVENSIREVERERESERERERERSKTSNDLGSGFQAIKSLRIKDKVRPWNTPVYAGNSRNSLKLMALQQTKADEAV